MINTATSYDAAAGLVLELLPEVGAVSPAFGENEGVRFTYRGLEYTFYTYEELIEVVVFELFAKKRKAERKEIKALRKHNRLQAELLSNRAS